MNRFSFAKTMAVAGVISLAASLVPTSAFSQSTNVIKIGIDLPVSGADASDGIPTRNGAVLAIEEAKAPAGFAFVVDALDDAVQGKHNPAQGAQNIKTFIADPAVLAIVGPFNSNVAKAEIPLTNDAGLVQISPSNTNPGLTKGPVAASLRSNPINSYFRVCTTDDKQGGAGAQFARKLGYSKVFIIDDNETYGKGLADVFEADFKTDGGTVLGHEHITSGQQDFKALLTKAASLGPDFVYFGGTTSSGGGLVRKQMEDAGLKSAAYFGGDGISDAEFITVTGDMANNSYYTVAAPETSKLASAAAFVAAYTKQFGATPGPYSANAYAIAQIEIAAIDKAIADGGGKVPTRAQVLANVAATKDIQTPIGKVGFDANGDTTNGILSLYAIKDGKAEFINQINYKS
jgi:branched-chain amino acid transport system substrate-binding protein